MTCPDILAANASLRIETTEPPACLSDLNLDQLIEAITETKQPYNLTPFFYTPLRDVETIRYRQAIMRELEDPALLNAIKSFSEEMATVYRYLAMQDKLTFAHHQRGWFLEAALLYCHAVSELTTYLKHSHLQSQGLRSFHQYLTDYCRSPQFESLQEEALAVQADLKQVRYSITIQPGRFSVRRYEGESDYTTEIEQVFARFRQGQVKDFLVKMPQSSGMNHIAAQILTFVARLYPAPFAALDRFYEGHRSFLDESIRTFDRGIQFYVAYLDFIAGLRRQGLPFCYPRISTTDRTENVQDAFDLALAHTLRYRPRPVICNDYAFQGGERIIVVSGPNQGGKTTFARMVGQLHYLAALGCPVPGRHARLFLPDQIFTHFEREEDIQNLRGKLQDDLIRTHDILKLATSDSLLIMNEVFASTTLEDAVFLSKEIMSRIMALDAACVWVTFIDELSRLSEKTVSMVSTVDAENPVIRTFKILRQPADGLAYALSIAHVHRLTYEQIQERIQP